MKRRSPNPLNAPDMTKVIESVEAAVRALRASDHKKAERRMRQVGRQVLMLLKLSAAKIQRSGHPIYLVKY